MSELELEERAADFWADTDLAYVFPRNIEQAIALKLPVTVVKLPVVTVQAAGQWLLHHHYRPAFPQYRRDLMGCLYADGGHGFIFVCGADEPEEQRFTLAHDTAHFLVDYWWPRQQVIQALGTSIINVLDGCRGARPEERMSAVLAHVRLGPHLHLLPRHGVDADADVQIAYIEDRADDLGLELVAPRKRILDLLGTTPTNQSSDLSLFCRVLGSYFSLPAYVFRQIVAAVCRQPAPSLLDNVLRVYGRRS